jgi:hypothetical protein
MQPMLDAMPHPIHPTHGVVQEPSSAMMLGTPDLTGQTEIIGTVIAQVMSMLFTGC